jgi:hypothetical protein
LTATATATAAVDGVSSASDFMAGFLRKLKVGKGWKQRYVTVAAEGCTLEYKKHKTDSRPLRSIDLSRAVVLEHVPPERLAPDAVRSKSWKGSTLGDVPEARGPGLGRCCPASGSVLCPQPLPRLGACPHPVRCTPHPAMRLSA